MSFLVPDLNQKGHLIFLVVEPLMGPNGMPFEVPVYEKVALVRVLCVCLQKRIYVYKDRRWLPYRLWAQILDGEMGNRVGS